MRVVMAPGSPTGAIIPRRDAFVFRIQSARQVAADEGSNHT